jgi:hypothetical protein
MMTYAEYEASQVMTYVMTYERARQVMTYAEYEATLAWEGKPAAQAGEGGEGRESGSPSHKRRRVETPGEAVPGQAVPRVAPHRLDLRNKCAIM